MLILRKRHFLLSRTKSGSILPPAVTCASEAILGLPCGKRSHRYLISLVCSNFADSSDLKLVEPRCRYLILTIAVADEVRLLIAIVVTTYIY